MTYQWKSGSRIKIDPNVAGKVCEELAEKHNLTAKALLEVSRDPSAPLHDAFEWDDSIAAEKYREDQARCIIRSLVIKPADTPPVRGFFVIKKADPTYQPTHMIMQRKDTAALLIQQALSEFMAVRRKYANLIQLSAIFNAIDEAARGEDIDPDN